MPRSAALSVLLMLVLASGADAQTVSSTTGAIDGRVDRHIERSAAGCDGHTRRRSHDGHAATR